MSRKLLQVLVTLATFMVAWLVTSPASAVTNRAPVCDPRGAIGFAPPPQIQDVELSLDIPADCGTTDVNPIETKNVMPDRSGLVDFSSYDEPASVNDVGIFGLVFVERLAVLRTGLSPPPRGFRGSLDRPPRA